MHIRYYLRMCNEIFEKKRKRKPHFTYHLIVSPIIYILLVYICNFKSEGIMYFLLLRSVVLI